MTKQLPTALTSYDLAKSFAVIFMIVDHVGLYFFPDESNWRVMGRLCVPVWFFLIGYANSRDLGAKLWVGAVVLELANLLAGMYLLPLNILWTIIALRLLIDPIMERALSNSIALWSAGLAFLFLAKGTSSLVEYGTQAIVLAMSGYLMRHQNDLGDRGRWTTPFLTFSLTGFVALQSMFLGFSSGQVVVLSIGMIAVGAMLYFFKPIVYMAPTRTLPSTVIWLLQLGGRRSLEIYVGHLLLFKTIAVADGRFTIFDWTLFPNLTR